MKKKTNSGNNTSSPNVDNELMDKEYTEEEIDNFVQQAVDLLKSQRNEKEEPVENNVVFWRTTGLFG